MLFFDGVYLKKKKKNFGFFAHTLHILQNANIIETHCSFHLYFWYGALVHNKIQAHDQLDGLRSLDASCSHRISVDSTNESDNVTTLKESE